MNARCFRVDWLIPALGIGIVVGFALAAMTYRVLERQADAELVFMPVLDRLCQDHNLSLALKMYHDGRVDEAAARLDLLLCWDVLRADAELARADARTRAWTEDILRKIARARPKIAQQGKAAPAPDGGGAREEAERVLERVLEDNSQRVAQTTN